METLSTFEQSEINLTIEVFPQENPQDREVKALQCLNNMTSLLTLR